MGVCRARRLDAVWSVLVLFCCQITAAPSYQTPKILVINKADVEEAETRRRCDSEDMSCRLSEEEEEEEEEESASSKLLARESMLEEEEDEEEEGGLAGACSALCIW